MPNQLVPADEAVFALGRLSPADQKNIDRAVIAQVVETFFEKRKRVGDVGEAIRYTLTERHLNNKSRDTYAAYARLLRKVERRRQARKEAA